MSTAHVFGIAPPRQVEPLVKGTLVVTVTKFVRAKGLSLDAVLARLPPPDQDILRGVLLPFGWYSAEIFARLVDAAAAESKEDPTRCVREMGIFSAHTNMGPHGIRRAYIREGDPHHVLGAISRIYQTVYSVGQRTYQRTGEHSAIISGHGTRVARDHCVWVAGWLQRVVELSGGRSVSVTEAQCERSGAPHCEYHIAWT